MYLMTIIALFMSLHFYAISGNVVFQYLSIVTYIFVILAFYRDYRKQIGDNSSMTRLDINLMLGVNFKLTTLYLISLIISFILFIASFLGYVFFQIDTARSVAYIAAGITGAYIVSYIISYMYSQFLLGRQKEYICGYRNR